MNHTASFPITTQAVFSLTMALSFLRRVIKDVFRAGRLGIK